MKKRGQIQARQVRNFTYSRQVATGGESINFTRIQFDELLKRHLKMPVSMVNL